MNQKEIGFNLSKTDIDTLFQASLKPEEIGGDAVTQLKRVDELIHWFVRLSRGQADPKWTKSHASELAYYIATTASNRFIDLKAVEMKAWKEGVNITPDERNMIGRFTTNP